MRRDFSTRLKLHVSTTQSLSRSEETEKRKLCQNGIYVHVYAQTFPSTTFRVWQKVLKLLACTASD